MFSDRNGAKTTPFGVVCAHTCISLYKRGPAPPRAKKPLVIARLLSTPPPPKKKKKKKKKREREKNSNRQQQQHLLLVTTTYYSVLLRYMTYKAWLRYANLCVAWFSLQGMGGLYRHHWVDQPGNKYRRETLQNS